MDVAKSGQCCRHSSFERHPFGYSLETLFSKSQLHFKLFSVVIREHATTGRQQNEVHAGPGYSRPERTGRPSDWRYV